MEPINIVKGGAEFSDKSDRSDASDLSDTSDLSEKEKPYPACSSARSAAVSLCERSTARLRARCLSTLFPAPKVSTTFSIS